MASANIPQRYHNKYYIKLRSDFYNSRNSQTAYQNFFSPTKKKLKDIP